MKRSRASDTRPPDTPQPIVPPAAVSRFIYDSDKIYKQTGKPKVGAFLPEYFNARHETSVCHLDGCPDHRVWHLAGTRRSDKILRARADFPIAIAVDQSLSCVSAPEEDFCEHAVIIDWPPDKEGQKRIALELATKSGPCRFPPDGVKTSAKASRST